MYNSSLIISLTNNIISWREGRNDEPVCFGNELRFFTCIINYGSLDTMGSSCSHNVEDTATCWSQHRQFIPNIHSWWVCASHLLCALAFPLVTLYRRVTVFTSIHLKTLLFLTKSDYGDPWLTESVDMHQACPRMSLGIVQFVNAYTLCTVSYSHYYCFYLQ